MSEAAAYSPLSAPFENQHEAIELGLELEKTFNLLSALLAKETDYAKAGKLRDAAALQSEKMRLTDLFLKMAERLRSNAGFFRKELPELAGKIQRLHASFCEEVGRNLTALITAKTLSESLIQEIIEAAKEGERTSGYTARGAAPNNISSAAPPLKLNRSM